ncbi:PREDICTED: antimicrobial peptide NK-lysin-like [Cyprinodon variegatus]|uniref:antimicrobial peptide NK-lysin-like n=1 Tax=Cyprinodon variegatus TaxID=28743 RepID=UPI00074275B5|nr:PREDICTED: antimicrobial peptide NK-lysin-like [Cyprinodon variegatus]
MENWSLFLLCFSLGCSVWMIQGSRLDDRIDEEDLGEPCAEEQGLSALCWACKLVMKKLKRILGPNATEERITTKLKVICNELGLLKSRCHRFVEKHLRVLVKELTTKDDVKTVCIKIRACR